MVNEQILRSYEFRDSKRMKFSFNKSNAIKWPILQHQFSSSNNSSKAKRIKGTMKCKPRQAKKSVRWNH